MLAQQRLGLGDLVRDQRGCRGEQPRIPGRSLDEVRVGRIRSRRIPDCRQVVPEHAPGVRVLRLQGNGPTQRRDGRLALTVGCRG
jgi:hypothetical protein